MSASKPAQTPQNDDLTHWIDRFKVAAADPNAVMAPSHPQASQWHSRFFEFFEPIDSCKYLLSLPGAILDFKFPIRTMNMQYLMKYRRPHDMVLPCHHIRQNSSSSPPRSRLARLLSYQHERAYQNPISTLCSLIPFHVPLHQLKLTFHSVSVSASAPVVSTSPCKCYSDARSVRDSTLKGLLPLTVCARAAVSGALCTSKPSPLCQTKGKEMRR
jgi:hypothetical protein